MAAVAQPTMVFVPELALSDHSSDLEHAAGGESSYIPGEADDWLSGEDEAADQLHQLAGPQQPPPPAATISPPAVLQEWDQTQWDDHALCSAFAAAKEEFFLYNDPIRPYAPYVVPDELRARAKLKGKESWKVRLALREAEARAAAEASDAPAQGCTTLSTLWYTRIGGRPQPKEAPRPESKRSKAKAARLRKAERALAQAVKAPVDPYAAGGASVSVASRKRKHPEDGSARAADDAPPLSPEAYTPISPSFSPTHTPLSPSLSASVPPDLLAFDFDQGVDVPNEEMEGVAEEGAEGEGEWDPSNPLVQLDPAQWDDAPLLSAWEQEETAFAARHGTGKSWLTLATEAQAQGISLEEHVGQLEAARFERHAAATASSAESTSGPEATGAGEREPPKVDKVAERHLRRFVQAPAPPAAGQDDVPELSYD